MNLNNNLFFYVFSYRNPSSSPTWEIISVPSGIARKRRLMGYYRNDSLISFRWDINVFLVSQRVLSMYHGLQTCFTVSFYISIFM
jgi:hypothetical protein